MGFFAYVVYSLIMSKVIEIRYNSLQKCFYFNSLRDLAQHFCFCPMAATQNPSVTVPPPSVRVRVRSFAASLLMPDSFVRQHYLLSLRCMNFISVFLTGLLGFTAFSKKMEVILASKLSGIEQ